MTALFFALIVLLIAMQNISYVSADTESGNNVSIPCSMQEASSCEVKDINISGNISRNSSSPDLNSSDDMAGGGTCSSNIVNLHFFYGAGCPHCARVEPFIKQMEETYKDKIKVHYHEIYHNYDNYKFFMESTAKFDIEKPGVPLVIIGKAYFMGDTAILDSLEKEIIECQSKDCACRLSCNEKMSGGVSPGEMTPSKITLPLILVSGLIDGINPCAFAVLIILSTYLLAIADRKRMLTVGMTYISSVYVTYFLAGLGLFSAFQFAGITKTIFNISAVLVILLGIVNLKDFFWYGKGITLEIPKSYKGTIKRYVRKASIPAAIILGVLVSMFELPCTGGIYLAILGMLSNSMTRMSAIPYLLLYNIMFIAPLIVILILIYKGYNPAKMEKERIKERKWMRLAMGILMVSLGYAMLAGWI